MTSRYTEKKSCPVSMSCSNPQASDPFYCLPSYLGHTLRNPPSPLPQTQAASSPSLQYHSPCPREGRAYLSDFTEPSFPRTRTALSPPLRFAFSPSARGAGVVAGLAFCVSITCSSPSSLPQLPYTAPSWLILEALQPQRELSGALLPGGIKREQHKMFLLCGAIILNFLDRFAGNYSYLHVCAGVLRTENRTPSLVSNLLLPLFLPD